jgi:hypothetical protein
MTTSLESTHFRLEHMAFWISSSIILGSLGTIISTTSQEPKVGTFMIALGFFILLWTSVVYLSSFDKAHSTKSLFYGLLATVILLGIGLLWLILSIWI